MTSTKTRHDFLADADATKLLNDMVQGSGVTKTEIIIQSIKAFAERGTDSEFAQRTAKRFDTLSRELEAVRKELDAARRDLGTTRRAHEKMQSDVTMTLESLIVFVRFSIAMSANVPRPDEDKQAVEEKRLRWFADEVERRTAAKEKGSPRHENGDKGSP